MLNREETREFSKILNGLGRTLDISETEFKEAVRSYEFVGNWLAQEDSALFRYEPEVLPQGSFMLGTMIKPVVPEEDLDIDLVCRLKGKQEDWTQADLKRVIGERLKAHGALNKLLDQEGRRCWTLTYHEDARFHLDILPAISRDYRVIRERKFSALNRLQEVDELSIHITDRKMPNYKTETNAIRWLRSNSFGYGIWFKEQASLDRQKVFSLLEAVQPVPAFEVDKLPLQVAVQILKRHRDMLFDGDPEKPISIIITTLAARAYGKQVDVADALLHIVENMGQLIVEKVNPVTGSRVKWVENPVNPLENFADKWVETPAKQEKFLRWLQEVRRDIIQALSQKGTNRIQEALGRPFGKEIVAKTFSDLATETRRLRESGQLRMATGTGYLGTSSGGIIVPQHEFHGNQG